MAAVLRGVHASPASKVMCMLNSISETQDEVSHADVSVQLTT
jgi:hypothetical protein